jgi:ABC-type phosphate transport system auxiliary subunit
MKIINPLYDKAFKYLMENNKIAKKVLSVILDKEVTEVALSQQETILPDEKRGLTLFRLDFKAVIREADGSKKTVLIELQKSKFATDIQRFRAYLGANYLAKKEKVEESVVAEAKSPEYQSNYPIITIYILGYKLDDLPYLAVTVNRDVINSVSKEKINVNSFFIDHLTHQSHIIQVLRLPEKQKTLLEKFLVLFNQAWCTNQPFILNLQNIPEEFADIAKYLQGPVMDDDFRRHLEAEEELDTIFDEQAARHLRQITEALENKRVAEEREQAARSSEIIALKQKEAFAVKLARQMMKYGANLSEIASETGLSAEEILNLE